MRRDYGDPPLPRGESIIAHLRKLCPGVWTYRHPNNWIHETGVVVKQSNDYTKSGFLWVGKAIGLARWANGAWEWFPGGERLLKQLTGAESELPGLLG